MPAARGVDDARFFGTGEASVGSVLDSTNRRAMVSGFPIRGAEQSVPARVDAMPCHAGLGAREYALAILWDRVPAQEAVELP